MNQLTMQGLFKVEKEAWLIQARKTAKELLQFKPFVTIEDVLRHCPRPEYLHRNTTGSVFNTSEFVTVGFTKAKKASSNGRIICQWGLNDGR